MTEQLDLSHFSAKGKNLTISVAAWLLAYFDDLNLWNKDQLQSFKSGIQSGCNQFKLSLRKDVAAPLRRDTNYSTRIQHFPDIASVVRLYTNYDVAKELVDFPDIVVHVDNEEDADFSLTVTHIKDFISIPIHRRVCQFPFEAGLIRKDLLPLTVRQYCYVNGESPNWWLPCYDLSTEFHLFAEDYRCRMNNAHEKDTNSWIIKPAQGTRGFGHRIVDNGSDESGLRLAAALAPQFSDDLLYLVAGATTPEITAQRIHPETISYNGVDRVAQLLVKHPLLVNNRKFDIRVFVFVRSFQPFEAYMHKLHYARLANKEYKLDLLQDKEVAITVSAYEEDEKIAEQQARLLCPNLRRAIEEQYEGIQYDDMLDGMQTMLRELFVGAGKSIGEWPQSSAYYSVDVIFDNSAYYYSKLRQQQQSPPSPTSSSQNVFPLSPAADEATVDNTVATSSLSGGESTAVHSTNNSPTAAQFTFTPVPKLVEVNFMGDWHGLEAAVQTHEQYSEWAKDLITVLATKRNVSDNERLVRL